MATPTKLKQIEIGGLLPKQKVPIDYSRFFDVHPQAFTEAKSITPPKAQTVDYKGAVNVATLSGTSSGTYAVETVAVRCIAKLIDIHMVVYGGTIELLQCKFYIRRGGQSQFIAYRFLTGDNQSFGEGIPLPDIYLEPGDELLIDYATVSASSATVRFGMQVHTLTL